MKTGWGLKVMYCLFIVYTCNYVLDIMKIATLLLRVKGIEDAYMLLDLDWYWIIKVVSALMADARDVISTVIVILKVIAPSYLLVTIYALYLFYRTDKFKAVIAMILLPYLLYGMLVFPLIIGVYTMKVNATFALIVTMAWIVRICCLVILALSIFKIALIGGGILEVKKRFNYND